MGSIPTSCPMTKRYSVKFEIDSLFYFLLKKYNISLTYNDMKEIEKFVYMREDKEGEYEKTCRNNKD